jgi:serine/threonine protein kinase
MESAERDPVDELADDFVARQRRGETPTVEEYAARYPEHADEIRDLFPAIAAMERFKPQPGPQRLWPGETRSPSGTLGDCRLIREIGRGGMGVVYEAEQESLGRRVAVKVLPGAGRVDDQAMGRFLREARTAASLHHGNIVPVFGAGEDQGLRYYIMPLIAGVGLDRVLRSLRQRSGLAEGAAALSTADPRSAEAESIADTLLDGSLAAESSAAAPARSGKPEGLAERPPGGPHPALGPLYWQCIARIGIQVADALEHAHEQGVWHRDIKPANLLLDGSGTVWVTDFGLAKAMADDDLSRTGDLVGTLLYMAPERFCGAADARSDIYSLGLTLYERLTLRALHLTGDRAEMIRQATEGRHEPPRATNPRIPRDLETIILKAIDPEPRFRYATAGALSADLARFCAGEPIAARRAAAPERLVRWIGRNRVVAALAITSIVLALFGAYFFYLFLTAPPWARPGRPPFPLPPP